MVLRSQIRAISRTLSNRSYLPTLVAFVVVISASIFATSQSRLIRYQNLRADVQNAAGLIQTRLGGELGADIHGMDGLVAALETEPDMNQARFSALVSKMIDTRSHIRNVAGAPDLILSLMYPMIGNEAAIGLDYNKIEAQRGAVYQARDTRSMVLAGPVDLVQGGRGLILRYPIFLGDGPDAPFWGILSAVIDIDRLFASSGVGDPRSSIELALIGNDGKGEAGDQFYGDPAILDDNPVRLTVELPTGTWQLAARPRGGWAQHMDEPWQLWLVLIAASALILVPTFLVGQLAAGRRQMIQVLERRERDLDVISSRLSMALKTSQLAIWEFHPDSDELIWDPQMNSLYGYPLDMTDHQFEHWLSRLHPDDRDQAVEQFEKCVEQGEAYDTEFRIYLDDGTEKYIRALGQLFVDKKSRRRLIGVNWDITADRRLRDELIQANRALAERYDEVKAGRAALEQVNAELRENQAELNLLSLVARHTTDAIVLLDAAGRVFWINDSFTRLHGFTLQEAKGKTPLELIYGPDSDPGAINLLTARTRAGHLAQAENLCYDRTGRRFWTSLIMVPIIDDDGRIAMHIGVGRDISESKKREAELAEAKRVAEQADRAKSEFLANMSHEIRTPMNGIIGMAGLLSESGLDEEQQEFAETIQSSALALLKIINDVLDLSRLEAGKMAITPVDFDLRNCIDGAVSILRPQAREKGLWLTVDYAPDLPEWVRGDDGRLRQILVNLIGNAVKFTRDGGVTLRVAAAGSQLEVEVEDTGIGITPEQMQRVFDRFSQADAATTRAFGGTGLGLTLSAILAERMGGGITLESEPGRGSCFRVKIQFDAATNPDTLPCNSAETGPIHLDPCTVLLADDNRTNRLLVRKYLAGYPLHIFEAENGREAVEICQAQHPDIVLMDMSMPELDGISATREIRKIDLPQPVIVALTANAFDSDRKECLAAGMDHFLHKPVHKNALLQTLAEIQAEHRTTANAQAI